jgi:hypothetical protein
MAYRYIASSIHTRDELAQAPAMDFSLGIKKTFGYCMVINSLDIFM